MRKAGAALSILIMASITVAAAAQPSRCPGKPQVCREEGERLQAAGQVVESIPFLQEACDARDSSACIGLAASLGQTGQKEKALQLQKGPCDQGEALACFNSGTLLRDSGDLPKAFAYLRKGCRLGFRPACAEDGRLKAEKKDWAGARTSLQKACELGHLESCHNWGVILRDQDKKLPLALKAFRKACEGGRTPDCGLWERGAQGNAAETRAIETHYDQQCREKASALHCYRLATLSEAGGRLETARDLYQIACDPETRKEACDKEQALRLKLGEERKNR